MFTWVEVDSRAIRHNLRQFRQLLGKNTLLMPVVKANAYGHGFLEIAKILDKNKDADRICVVNSEEAVKLVEAKIKKPIQILSFFDFNNRILLKLARLDEPSSARQAKKQVIFPFYTLEQAKILNTIGERVRKKIKIHLKIDTGASRVGILPNDLNTFIVQLKKYKNLEIEGVFSHFASSETDRGQTIKQYKIFQNALRVLRKSGINPPIRHMSCTSASALFAFKDLNAARLGLGLYGLYPAEKMKKILKLKPALSWLTKIIQIKTVLKGTKIGYGGSYNAKKDTKLAILPVGYWDGFDRKLSNNGYVLIKSKLCPIRGRICMNLSMVDVSAIKNVKAGDTVTLIGTNGNKTISADDLARQIGTINYEVVDRINPLIQRIIKKT